MFYDAHVKKTGVKAVKNRAKTATNEDAAADPLQGWVGRNSNLGVKDGALHITPEKSGKPFITRTNLELVGPVTATLRVRSAEGCDAEVSWRTQAAKDFGAAEVARFKVPASSDFQEVKVNLPVDGKMIHVRVTFPGAVMPEIASVEMVGAKGSFSTNWSGKQ